MKNILKTTFVLTLVTVLFLLVGSLVGGRSGAIVALFMAGIFNFGTFWFSDKIVLKMQRAVPVSETDNPQLHKMVAELAEKDGLPMPSLYIVDTPVPNAFATGRSPKKAVVAVTTGIKEILSPDELRAVIAHELGHIKNRDMLVSTTVATLAGALSFMADLAFWGGSLFSSEEDRNPIGSLVLMIVAPIAAILIQMAVSRSREYMADEHGAKLHGKADDLASALMKLDDFKNNHEIRANPTEQAAAHLMFANMFNAGLLQSIFSTHPSTKSRVERLSSL